ncbi:MAG TPA: glycosyltransferase, partial [Anaerolineae bacterium]|nr:glycosyltransferase [Anaerolineae bacterium]
MRILMIAPTSFFGDYGGHIRILEETLALQELGHEVLIVTYYKGNDVPGLTIKRTWPLPYRAEYEVGSSRHKIAFDIYLAGAALFWWLRWRPDVIHGHMHEGALIGGVLSWLSLGRTPLVFDFQGSLTAEMVDHGFLDPDRWIYRAMFRLERFICRRLPKAILTSSVRSGRMLADKFEVAEEQIVPLPDCVDTSRFDPERFAEAERLALKGRLGIPAERPVVAYLGLLADYQGIPDLLRAAAYLKEWGEDVHFLIMGYPRVAQYRAEAERLGVAERVTLPGRVKYDEAPFYLGV